MNPIIKQRSNARLSMVALVLPWLFALQGMAYAHSVDLHSAAKASASSDKILLVLVTMDDCQACAKLDRAVLSKPDVKAALSRQFQLQRVSVSDASPLIDTEGATSTAFDLARRFRVSGTPSLLFFDGDGHILYRHSGLLDARQFIRLLYHVTRGDYEHAPFVASPSIAGHARH